MAAFIAIQYAGELQLSLRYDSRCVSEQQARELVEHCEQQLQQFCELPRGTT
jgi:hypothetical protein